MSPEALRDFAERSGLQITYDISHSMLSANHEHRPLREYTEILAPLAATCTLLTVRALTVRAYRSTRVTLTGLSWLSSLTAWPPACPSSRKSGWATLTTARASGTV